MAGRQRQIPINLKEEAEIQTDVKYEIYNCLVYYVKIMDTNKQY